MEECTAEPTEGTPERYMEEYTEGEVHQGIHKMSTHGRIHRGIYGGI